ncbi:MAG: hypothetical protein PUC30_04995 [Lachnospiraceae bacterium]|nr:hypothetical protein [Lachnospiraceae bacterium]
MKNKAAKIIFLISFLPWLLIPVCGILGAIFGVGFFFSTCYGWDGFFLGVLGAVLGMTMIPVLPVCLVYEICYVLHSKVPRLRKVSTKKFFVSALVLCVVVAGSVLAYVFQNEIERTCEKVSAKRLVGRAEVMIPYGTYTSAPDGIYGIEECTCETILIDYDRHEVGFLYNALLGEFHKEKLRKADTEEENQEVMGMTGTGYVQAVVPLSTPGKRLVSFYTEPDNSHLTGALLLEMENGEVYYAKEVREKSTGFECYFGLSDSEYYVGEGKHLLDLETEK